jgi:glucose-1-phosphate adenylyltransferase
MLAIYLEKAGAILNRVWQSVAKSLTEIAFKPLGDNMIARQPIRKDTGRYVSRLTSGTVAIIMAGGRGERLKALTQNRCKPATPFGGKFRIIDFVLSNCVNSGIRQIAVLTQYKAQSLIQHIQRGWSYLRGEMGEFVEIIPAQQQTGEHWYRGTADSVYQNLDFLRSHHPTHVLILAGDHIYKMDYGPMIAYHEQCEADITVGVVDVPIDRAREFGIMTTDETNRVVKFAEKPAKPDPIPDSENLARASMGIYVIAMERLEKLLIDDAANTASSHDFGKNIIPPTIDTMRVFAYPFQNIETRAQSYWRDVGSLDALYEANMELVAANPELNIYDRLWPIWTYQAQQPPAKFVLNEEGRRGMAVNSMVTGGCIISGAYVADSLLSTEVRIDEGSRLESSVLLPGATVGRKCHIRRCIMDELCVIPDGMNIGIDRHVDAQRFYVTEGGVVLVTPDMLKALD